MHTTLAVLGAVVGIFFVLYLLPLLGEIRIVQVREEIKT